MYLSPPTTVPRFAPLLDAVLMFDGVDDVVVANPVNPLLQKGFTALFWIELSQVVELGRNAGVLGIAGNTTQGAWWRVEATFTTPPQLRASFAGTEVVVPLAGLGSRVFVATVYDADAMSLTVTADGAISVTVNRTTPAGAIPEATVPVTIGHTGVPADPHYPGAIALVRLFNRPLSAAECADAMRRNTIGARAEVDGLVGDWRLNEGYGTVAFDYARMPGAGGDLGNGDPDAVPAWLIATY